jgi:hypothetical protein
MGLAACREGTPSPSISGIIELAGDCKLNLGAQSLTGKILISKNLLSRSNFPNQAKIGLEWATRGSSS